MNKYAIRTNSVNRLRSTEKCKTDLILSTHWPFPVNRLTRNRNYRQTVYFKEKRFNHRKRRRIVRTKALKKKNTQNNLNIAFGVVIIIFFSNRLALANAVTRRVHGTNLLN